MKLFVTGGDGLLGSNLIRELLKRSHEIQVLVQPGHTAHTLHGLKLDLFEADLLDYKCINRSVENIDAIFHLAANTSIWPSRNRKVRSINIAGTYNILRLAKERQVERLIYVGTANSFSWGDKRIPGIEGTPYKGKRYGLDYMDSKWEAHKMVLNAIKVGLPAIIVNPTFMLGPYDSKPSSGEMIRAIYKGNVPGYAPGGRNFINVKDAVTGIANALEQGRIGESYIIGNQNMSYKEAFCLIADTLNVRPPKFSIPKFLILIYGFMGSAIGGISGRKPKVTFPMAKISCDTHFYSSQKAVNELGLPQTPIREGILECFNWFKSKQMI